MMIGRYRLEGQLDGHSHRDECRGFDPMLERPVVLKVFPFPAADPAVTTAIKQAFYREMQRTGLLMHHGIAQLFDAGEHSGALFMATEYVEGERLSGRLAAGLDWDLPHRASLLAQMLDALEFASQIHVPHLALTPDAIVIAPGHVVKVGGF